MAFWAFVAQLKQRPDKGVIRWFGLDQILNGVGASAGCQSPDVRDWNAQNQCTYVPRSPSESHSIRHLRKHIHKHTAGAAINGGVCDRADLVIMLIFEDFSGSSEQMHFSILGGFFLSSH